MGLFKYMGYKLIGYVLVFLAIIFIISGTFGGQLTGDASLQYTSWGIAIVCGLAGTYFLKVKHHK
jgi:hypothetical protein